MTTKEEIIRKGIRLLHDEPTDDFGPVEMSDEERSNLEAVKAVANIAKDYLDIYGALPTHLELTDYVCKQAPDLPRDYVHKLVGDFSSVLAQVTQPKGGSENLTNLRSPGQPPAKVQASPGQSGSSQVFHATRGTSKESVEEFTGRAYDSAGEYSQSDPNRTSPPEFIGSDKRHPAYGAGRRNIRGSGYEPYAQKSLGRKWLESNSGLSKGRQYQDEDMEFQEEELKDDEDEEAAKWDERGRAYLREAETVPESDREGLIRAANICFERAMSRRGNNPNKGVVSKRRQGQFFGRQVR